MQRALFAFTLLAVAACAAPDTRTDDKTYEEPAVVTGSRVPRRAPSGVQSIDGDAVRAQGQIAPGRGMAGQKGQQ